MSVQTTLSGTAARDRAEIRADASEPPAYCTQQGVNWILFEAGKRLDDPDPVRVSKWVVRLQREGLI